MNEIQLFTSEMFGNVRVVTINEEPWFVGKDVAECLGYSNASKAVIMHVDDDDKKKEMLELACSQNGNVPKGATQTTLINESGIYSLVFSSKLPTAKQFKHWVTSEVLPSVRKYGAYMTDDALKKAIQTPEFLIELATALKEEKEKRQKAEQIIIEQKPKVLFSDAVETSDNSVLIGDLAKILNQNGIDIGSKRLFAWMRENGYLIKSGDSYNMPTQSSMNKGLFEVKVRTITKPDDVVFTVKTTKVTGKGQIYFVNKFLNKDERMAVNE